MHTEATKPQAGTLQMPAPTVWPMVLALGLTLLLAGIVTYAPVSVLGLVLAASGAVGWFRQMFPREAHIAVKVQTEEIAIASTRVLRPQTPASPGHRRILPTNTFTLMAGVRGGIAGGIAMTVPAGIYSLVKYHSFWYATNLLAAGGFTSWAGKSNAFLGQFHWSGALAALAIHGTISLLVGLLYGAILPMFPRWPVLTAGVLVPLFFTAITYSVLGVVSPLLNQRIDWWWFVPSQIMFGLVCGYVVNLHERVRTPQFRSLPFAVRAGLHADRNVRPDNAPQPEDDREGSN